MREWPRLGFSSSSVPLPFVAIFGADGDEVGGEFDFAILQIDRVGQIDDRLVVDIGDRH